MKHKIKGVEISPDNRFDIGVSIDFEARVDQQKMTTDTLVLSREGNKIVKDHIKDIGLLEGIPYEIEFAPLKTIKYFIDLTNGLKVYDNKVHVSVTNYLGHDQFFDKAEDLIWDLVNISNPIPAITINYQVVPQDANARALTCYLGIFTISVAIANQSKEVKERANEVIYASIPIVGAGLPPIIIVDYNAIALASIKLALSLIFLAILAYQALLLGTQLFRLLNPPLNKLQASKALHLLQNGCNHLGYKFECSILEGDYADMVILPIPQNRQNPKWYDSFTGDVNGMNKHFPQASDTTGTLGSLLYAMENMFNAKAKVQNGVVKLERWDYWNTTASKKLSTSLVVQADRVNMFEYDFSKLFKRYYIHYLADYSDYNTIDAFENNLAEYSLDIVGAKTDPKLNLIKGLKEKIIPFALAKRKDKISWLEFEIKKLYMYIDYLSLGQTNLVAKKNKLGAIQITDPFFSTTKIFMWDKAHGARKDQTILTPTYLWDNFHYINNPEVNQYIIKRGVKIKLSSAEFVDILDKNFVIIEGKQCEILKIDYFDEKNYAIIEYKQPYNVFNNQFKLTKIY